MKMLRLLLLLSLLFLVLKASSQQLAPSIIWQKSLGGSNNDKANCIIRTVDNGFLIVGSTNSNNGDVSGYHGGTDAWVVKLSSNGNIEWQRSLGGTSSDQFISAGVASDGSYLCMGTTMSIDG